MSLIIVLGIIEIGGWIGFNHIYPFSTPRSKIAMTVATICAGIAVLYAEIFQPPLVSNEDLVMFAAINVCLAAIIAFVSMTRQESQLSRR